jgi:hypothetical protein
MMREYPYATVILQPGMPECTEYMYGSQILFNEALTGGNKTTNVVHRVNNLIEPLAPAGGNFFRVREFLRKLIPPDGPNFKFLDCSGFALNGTQVVTRWFHTSAMKGGAVDCVHHSGPGKSSLHYSTMFVMLCFIYYAARLINFMNRLLVKGRSFISYTRSNFWVDC